MLKEKSYIIIECTVTDSRLNSIMFFSVFLRSTFNNIIVSIEAILSVENCGKPLGARGSAPNTASGELTALPQIP